MSNKNLRQQLEEAQKTIALLQDELTEMNKGINGLNFELEQRIDELSRVNIELQREITKRIQAEEEIKSYAAKLENANKELETFAYSVSHDLRTPLRAIDGFSRILIEDFNEKLDDEGRRVLNVIRSNTVRMGQLIDDILSFSRLGRIEMNALDIDMEKLARSVVNELKPTVHDRNVELIIGTLPPSQGDKAMIRVVIVNLVNNAIKFTRPRTVARIEIGGRTENSENIYFVRDNGVGFDMNYQTKLFGVFQRLHSQDEFEGTGIGLALVKQVITRHGGRVWAEGKVDEGAVIHFTLPQKKEKENEHQL